MMTQEEDTVRTTLNLDEDVLDHARRLAEKSGKAFRLIVNEAMRLGLAQANRPARRRPYRTRPRKMGLRPQYSLDNIQELLASVEGESSR